MVPLPLVLRRQEERAIWILENQFHSPFVFADSASIPFLMFLKFKGKHSGDSWLCICALGFLS